MNHWTFRLNDKSIVVESSEISMEVCRITAGMHANAWATYIVERLNEAEAFTSSDLSHEQLMAIFRMYGATKEEDVN